MTATIYGAPEGFDALLLARRRREHPGSVLHVTRDDARMARLAEALAVFAPDSKSSASPPGTASHTTASPPTPNSSPNASPRWPDSWSRHEAEPASSSPPSTP